MARGDAELPALRVGVDIVEVERIAGAVARWGDRFLRRVFTPEELAYCQGNIPSLAARWAAKEAVVKALETGA
jgi:holo-[acyl-carrier protein] synthase